MKTIYEDSSIEVEIDNMIDFTEVADEDYDQIYSELLAIAENKWIPTQVLEDELSAKYPDLVIMAYGYKADNYVESYEIIRPLDQSCFGSAANKRDALMLAIETMDILELREAEALLEAAKDYSDDIRKGTIIGLTKRMEQAFNGRIEVSVNYEYVVEERASANIYFYDHEGNCHKTLGVTASTKKLALQKLEKKLHGEPTEDVTAKKVLLKLV